MSKKYRVHIEFKEEVGVDAYYRGAATEIVGFNAYHFDEYGLHLYSGDGGEEFVNLGDHILFISIMREEYPDE